MTEPCRTRVDCYTDSPPVRKLWGGILSRSDTSAFPRDASGGFTRCCCLSHCVGRGGECGFGVFVDICRIVSDEGESAALAFLSIAVALCRSRGSARLWCFCRYLSHYVGRGRARLRRMCRYLSHFVGRGEESGFGVLSISVVLCRSRGSAALDVLSITVALCRTKGSAALVFLSISVALCRSRVRARLSGAASGLCAIQV